MEVFLVGYITSKFIDLGLDRVWRILKKPAKPRRRSLLASMTFSLLQDGVKVHSNSYDRASTFRIGAKVVSVGAYSTGVFRDTVD